MAIVTGETPKVRHSASGRLPHKKHTGEWQWPFSERNLALEFPVATVLLNELASLDAELRIATGQRPKLDAYLSDLNDKAQKIVGAIKEKEAELSAAIAANEVIAQMGTRNNAAARVVGRISLFLENLAPNEELTRLEAEHRRLKLKVEDMEKRIGADDSNDRLNSILNIITRRRYGELAPRISRPAARHCERRPMPPLSSPNSR